MEITNDNLCDVKGHLLISDVGKSFFVNGDRRSILKNINLEVPRGSFVSLLGRSGSGKTTLLNCIAGFIRPDEGEIRLDGKPISGPGVDRAVVFQDHALLPWYTVGENVGLGPRLCGKPAHEVKELVSNFLELVRLGDRANAYPAQLSGGMKQRVGIARALAANPLVLLMDEPFGALDSLTRQQLQVELMDIWERTQKTVIFVTHSVTEATFLSDRVIILDEGGSIGTDTNLEKLSRPRQRTSQEFNEFVSGFNKILGVLDHE